MSALRLFVTATDTGVGKTQAACALLRLLARAGARPLAFKPYESGVSTRPLDAAALARAAGAGQALEEVCLHRFRAPLAPGVAAAREGRVPSFAATLRAYRRFAGRSLVVEGAGGLLVPLDPRRDVIDLIAALELPVLLVARAGLGTLNHTGLSLLALERRRIPVRAVLLVKNVPGRDPAAADNPRLLHERHGIPVLGPVPFVRDPARRAAAFARALAPLLASRPVPAQ